MFDFLKDQTFWTALADGLAMLSLGVAIFAYRVASRASLMKIPAPYINKFVGGALAVRIRTEDQSLFGIVAVKIPGQRITGAVYQNRSEPGGAVQGYVPEGPLVRSLKFDPPASDVLFCPERPSKFVMACIASRSARSVRSWIKITI